jgi:DNA-binding CsgD family transcriptional regulator
VLALSVKVLSDTELRTLPHCSQNYTDTVIAAVFDCAISTAHAHRGDIMAKLDLRRQAALQQWSLKHGFFDLLHAAPPAMWPGWTAADR